MNDIREQLIELLNLEGEMPRVHAETMADRILAIPEMERAGEAVARLRDLFEWMDGLKGSASMSLLEPVLAVRVGAELQNLRYLLSNAPKLRTPDAEALRLKTVKPLEEG